MSTTETPPASAGISSPQPTGDLISREAWQRDHGQAQGLGHTSLGNLVQPLNIRDVNDPALGYGALSSALDVESDVDVDGAVALLSRRIEEIMWPASEQVASGGNPFLSLDSMPPVIDRRPLIMQDPWVKEYLDKRDISDAHQQLVEAWPSFTRTFANGIQSGIDQGYIPGYVAARLDGALARTKVRMADGAILGIAAGEYRNDVDEVWVRHDLVELGDSIEHLLVHELTHKLSGGTFIIEGETGQGSYRLRAGFGTELRPKEKHLRIGLNEAVTQHMTMGIVTGDFETFDPDRREDGDRRYYEYRKVVGTFIDRSKGLVDIRTLTNAFYEDTEPNGNIEARRKLVREVREAYGVGALNKLEELCGLTQIVDATRFDQVILSRIHAPEVDAQGNVVKQGWIDIENMPTLFELYSL